METTSEITMKEVELALRELADEVDECVEPETSLFSADAFWTKFNDKVKPFVKSVIDNSKMD